MFNFRRKHIIDPGSSFLLPVERQIKAWRRANRRMRWGIKEEAFAAIAPPLPLTARDRADGYIGSILSYGFGKDRLGNADAVLSGRLAWEYAVKQHGVKTWRCRYIDFDKQDCFRLRPEAPARSRGFYHAKFRPGDQLIDLTVAQYLKKIGQDTGCGPEGLQMIIITHPHVMALMNQRKIAFMAFADYDVAPYGFGDFFDALQMFCSNGVLGLGIGNVDQNYPMFGIPALRFQSHPE